MPEIRAITGQQIEHWFKYHPPRNEQTADRHEKLRHAGKLFAKMILECTPPCADQSAAIRCVRAAVAWANAAIACDGK